MEVNAIEAGRGLAGPLVWAEVGRAAARMDAAEAVEAARQALANPRERRRNVALLLAGWAAGEAEEPYLEWNTRTRKVEWIGRRLPAMSGVGRQPSGRAALKETAERCGAAARLLEEIAGTRRSRLTGAMRHAARAIRAMSAAVSEHRGDAARDSMRAARLSLIEAASIASHLPERAVQALCGTSPPEGEGLQELIYLARAGIRPFRQLAATRLGDASVDRGQQTLRQLLYADDAQTREAAFWSLLRAEAEPKLFLRVFEAQAGEFAVPGRPLLPLLLLAGASDAPESCSFTDAALECAGEELRALREVAAGLLVAADAAAAGKRFSALAEAAVDSSVRGDARRWIRRLAREGGAAAWADDAAQWSIAIWRDNRV